jgi:hypothetical protein
VDRNCCCWEISCPFSHSLQKCIQPVLLFVCAPLLF